MVKEEIKNKIKQIFVGLFTELSGKNFDFVKKQSEFDNWDSFTHMKLIAKIEEEFSIEIPLSEALEAESPADFAAIIEDKLRLSIDHLRPTKVTNPEPSWKNFSQVLSHWAVKAADKTFIIDLTSGQSYSYSVFNRLVNATTRFLSHQGVESGDIVLLRLKNSLEFLLIYFASIRLGSIINSMPTSVGEKELVANIEFLKPRLVLLDEDISPETTQKYKIFGIELEGKSALINLLRQFSDEDLAIEFPEDRPVCLYYSSGTTAKPKGILFSHRGILNIISSTCQAFGHNSGSIHLGVLPMGHTAIMHHSVLPVLYVGGTFILAESFMKVRKDFWHIIEKYQVNYVQTVPTIILMLLNSLYPDYQRQKLVLPYIACGSASLSAETKQSFEKKFGLRLANLYGLSEAGHLVSDYPFEGKSRPTNIGIGRPLSIVEVKLLDDQGQEVATGQVGEIAVKTPGLFLGYYQNQKLYESCFKDGYFCTGDLARKDEAGLFYYVGRKKDLIIKGGVNISPDFVDEVLIKHPKVAEAASVGKPDSFFGEVVKSFVVVKSGQTVSEKELLRYCQDKLGEFKSPSEIEFIDSIPKTASGKILRRGLRQGESSRS